MANNDALLRLIQIIGSWENESPAVYIGLTLLNREYADEFIQAVHEGMYSLAELGIDVTHSSSEYTNQIAWLTIQDNSYLFTAEDGRVYLSRINNFSCRIANHDYGVLVYHQDHPGIVHSISRILADEQINIASMQVSRVQRGKEALLVCLTDQPISKQALELMKQIPAAPRLTLV